ncbi:unnamed protein product [Amoebophrya sp. A25]|nr:unnamed protein product [Amoebophrya sp. A25]|eukprot:GSA25T00015890001.1
MLMLGQVIAGVTMVLYKLYLPNVNPLTLTLAREVGTAALLWVIFLLVRAHAGGRSARDTSGSPSLFEGHNKSGFSSSSSRVDDTTVAAHRPNSEEIADEAEPQEEPDVSIDEADRRSVCPSSCCLPKRIEERCDVTVRQLDRSREAPAEAYLDLDAGSLSKRGRGDPPVAEARALEQNTLGGRIATSEIEEVFAPDRRNRTAEKNRTSYHARHLAVGGRARVVVEADSEREGEGEDDRMSRRSRDSRYRRPQTRFSPPSASGSGETRTRGPIVHGAFSDQHQPGLSTSTRSTPGDECSASTSFGSPGAPPGGCELFNIAGGCSISAGEDHKDDKKNGRGHFISQHEPAWSCSSSSNWRSFPRDATRNEDEHFFPSASTYTTAGLAQQDDDACERQRHRLNENELKVYQDEDSCSCFEEEDDDPAKVWRRRAWVIPLGFCLWTAQMCIILGIKIYGPAGAVIATAFQPWQPIGTLVLTAMVLRTESLSAAKVAGIMCGILGASFMICRSSNELSDFFFHHHLAATQFPFGNIGLEEVKRRLLQDEFLDTSLQRTTGTAEEEALSHEDNHVEEDTLLIKSAAAHSGGRSREDRGDASAGGTQEQHQVSSTSSEHSGKTRPSADALHRIRSRLAQTQDVLSQMKRTTKKRPAILSFLQDHASNTRLLRSAVSTSKNGVSFAQSSSILHPFAQGQNKGVSKASRVCNWLTNYAPDFVLRDPAIRMHAAQSELLQLEMRKSDTEQDSLSTHGQGSSTVLRNKQRSSSRTGARKMLGNGRKNAGELSGGGREDYSASPSHEGRGAPTSSSVLMSSSTPIRQVGHTPSTSLASQSRDANRAFFAAKKSTKQLEKMQTSTEDSEEAPQTFLALVARSPPLVGCLLFLFNGVCCSLYLVGTKALLLRFESPLQLTVYTYTSAAFFSLVSCLYVNWGFWPALLRRLCAEETRCMSHPWTLPPAWLLAWVIALPGCACYLIVNYALQRVEASKVSFYCVLQTASAMLFTGVLIRAGVNPVSAEGQHLLELPGEALLGTLPISLGLLLIMCAEPAQPTRLALGSKFAAMSNIKY